MSDERRSRGGIYVAIDVLIPVVYVMSFVPAVIIGERLFGASPSVTRASDTFYYPLVLALEKSSAFREFCSIQVKFWDRIGLKL